ncbi:MAG: beta-propeller domain-containing protein [Deltaproteobacteria bacterium]|jgi:hypothetical protein|nr:beta-propeller domain-containing protein [Deltaproteobacteria bacterium]MBW2537640.1 beta-propeller domain-containing protein [Deltaproteobacteria bacterium]
MKHPSIIFAGLAVVGLGCGAATDETSLGPVETGEASAALIPITSCSDVEDAIRQSALVAMNERLNQAMWGAIEQLAYCDEWGYGEDGGDFAGSGGAGQGAPTDANDDGGASEVSETNNQVAGVDEADFIKNDDQYLYVVSDGRLRIIDAWPAPDTHVLSETVIDGEPRKLFVADDQALVYSAIGAPTGDGYYPGGGECTYGYDCDFTGDGTATQITVLDISDRTAPVVPRVLELSGSYLSSRRIGTAVFTVVQDGGSEFSGLRYYPDSLGYYYCDPDIEAFDVLLAFQELRDINTTLIMNAPLGDWLPELYDSERAGRGGQSENLLARCEDFYRTPLGDGSGFLTLVALDLAAPAELSATTVFSRPGATYASADALYLAVRQQPLGGYWYPSMDGLEQASIVHKFDLETQPAGASYSASGVVKGAVLNQFAMDEHDHHLRIATTTGHVPSPDVHSTMTVLAQQGPMLAPVGMVDQIAPTEDIRSVRFSGDRAFVVTFKKTDPLFVFDLSNPRQPKILSELKIPGFSTYMHMMDDTHLLTIGYDADDQGSFAWFTGVMLQIFDVSDPLAPTLVHKEIIGTRGSSSEALNNHLAFNYFAPKDLLALPMTICEDSYGGGSYGEMMTFSGLMVYDTTVQTGFHLRGRVYHPPATGYGEASCSNWWTDASSQVKRSVIMDDYVFSVSSSLIKVNHLDDLPNDVTEVAIADPVTP